MTDNEVTLGEIYRTVTRLELVMADVSDKLEQVGPLVVRVTSAEVRLDKLEPTVHRTAFYAATVTGGIAVGSFLIALLLK
jgi:hypothetical protein